MKKKINKSLMGTATLAIISTLLLTVAVCYHILMMRLPDEPIFKIKDYVDELVKCAIPYVAVALFVLFAVCILMSLLLTEGIMRPFRLIAKDIKNLKQMEAYQEMTPFINAIRNQHADVLQSAKIRQEFTANVSHELKTPLTAISGYAELIENEMVADGEEVRRFAKEIHGNANRLLTLINDVIRLSELDDAQMEDVMEVVDIGLCAQACVNMLQISAEKHDVTLSLLEESAVIHASKQMVDEVLYNLCDNAIRYNHKGGSVEVIVKKCADTAVLIVKDTGIGIPAEHQERIFERFYRVDKSRSKSTGGTGLGLAIVKHILLRLNAGITLESEVGEGTTITVVFPAVNENGKK